MRRRLVGRCPLSAILCFIGILALTVIVPSGRGVLRAQIPAVDDDKVVPIIPTANRYEQGKLFLERADKLLKPSADVEYQVLLGNVMFRRGDMYMYCDSAHIYDATSSLEAFGNVKMEQGDTLFVYADELEYADSTQRAILYADPGKKVRLINRDVELQTDVFNYDMSIELGYYEVGGELIDKQNRLTSVYGEYAPKTKDAIFRNNVHLNSLSRGDTLNIYTDALYYNTDTHIAELDAPSTILSKDGTIYTDNGVYNTETDVADLYERSMVVTSTGKTLTGDTLYYDHKLGYGQAWGNMVLNDTVNKSKLFGDYGFYNELTDSAFVTGNALAVDYSQPDSLSLHGDTIQAYRVITITRTPIVVTTEPTDSIANDVDNLFSPGMGEIVLADSISVDSVNVVVALADSLSPAATAKNVIEDEIVELVSDSVPTPQIHERIDSLGAVLPDTIAPVMIESASTLLSDTIVTTPPVPEVPMIETADTTHHIVAYPNVRFYRRDLQGVCDSMTFVQKDSLLYMDIDPIVWSDQRQIFGEQIIVHMNDSTADRVNLPQNAFMAEMLEEGYYNQLSGREMVAYLADKTLKHIDVSGNVTLIFFPMEEDSTYNKIANAESSFLAADFDRGQITRLKMWSQSNETITPLYLAKKSLFFLPGFRWESDRRPKGHDDVLPPKVEPAVVPADDEDNDGESAETDVVAKAQDTPEKEDLTSIAEVEKVEPELPPDVENTENPNKNVIENDHDRH